MPPPVSSLDLESPDVTGDPYRHFEALRSRGDVHYLPKQDLWLVLGYQAVQSAFARPQHFSNRWYKDVDAVLLGADPPNHSPVRRLVSRQFSAEALGRLTDVARASAEKLMKPEMDAVGEFAGPLSRAVAAELIGFSDATVAEIVKIPQLPFPPLTESLDRFAGSSRMYAAFLQGGEGLVADAEARSLVRLMWLAATTTTERLISHSVLQLVRDPELYRRVAQSRTLVPRLIEEVLRLFPSEHMVLRGAAVSAELAGVAIPADARLQLCIAAANRDPRVFEDPEALKLDRPPARHFAFGSGIHHCVGAPLARRVAGAALNLLLDRARDLRALEDLDRVAYFRSMSARYPERLAVGL